MNKKNLLLILPALLVVSCGKTSTSSTASTNSGTSSSLSGASDASSSAVSSSVSNSSSAAAPTFIIEAEGSPDIEDYTGPGFSGTASGPECIQVDGEGLYQASGGKFVSYLYANNATLSYTFTSSKAVSKAKLSWRISGEFYNMSFSCTDCQVLLNNTVSPYSKITWTDVPTQSSGKKKVFQDYVASASANILEGENTIVYRTANTNALGGTMVATAPLLDCFKIDNYGDAKLSWTPTEY